MTAPARPHPDAPAGDRTRPGPGAPGCGPYDNMWQAAHPVRTLDPRWECAPLWREHGPHDGWTRPALAALGRTLIEDACGAAGVRPGAFDTEVVYWLAHQEPEICVVVAGLIERAGQARGEDP